MRPQDSAEKAGRSQNGGEVKFEHEISAIIDKHEKKLLSSIHKPRREVFSSDEVYE